MWGSRAPTREKLERWLRFCKKSLPSDVSYAEKQLQDHDDFCHRVRKRSMPKKNPTQHFSTNPTTRKINEQKETNLRTIPELTESKHDDEKQRSRSFKNNNQKNFNTPPHTTHPNMPATHRHSQKTNFQNQLLNFQRTNTPVKPQSTVPQSFPSDRTPPIPLTNATMPKRG